MKQSEVLEELFAQEDGKGIVPLHTGEELAELVKNSREEAQGYLAKLREIKEELTQVRDAAEKLEAKEYDVYQDLDPEMQFENPDGVELNDQVEGLEQLLKELDTVIDGVSEILLFRRF